MIIDHPLVSRSVFHPRRSSVEPTLVVDVPGARLGCFFCRRDPEAGVLLYFHGNGELAVDYASTHAEMFLDMGVNVCFCEYRGYGASTGEPTLGGMLGDGERIVEALGFPPEKVVAFGRSLGSIYALELVRRLPGVAGLIIESGIADVLDGFRSLAAGIEALGVTSGEIAAEIDDQFGTRSILAKYAGSLLILHAANDHLVERSHADRLYAWAGTRDKRLLVFPEGNHNTILIMNYPEYVRAVETLLGRAGIVAIGK